jgi:predicted nucleic acid-binding protein
MKRTNLVLREGLLEEATRLSGEKTYERAYRLAREAMLALPAVESPLRIDLVEEAVGLYRTARKRGLTVRSSVDCLIAACALRHDLEVLHRDRDFTAIASVSQLRQRSV